LDVSRVVLGNRRLMPAAGNAYSENNCDQQNAELTCIHNYLLKRNVWKVRVQAFGQCLGSLAGEERKDQQRNIALCASEFGL
jgi:hypothetical protein